MGLRSTIHAVGRCSGCIAGRGGLLPGTGREVGLRAYSLRMRARAHSDEREIVCACVCARACVREGYEVLFFGRFLSILAQVEEARSGALTKPEWVKTEEEAAALLDKSRGAEKKAADLELEAKESSRQVEELGNKLKQVQELKAAADANVKTVCASAQESARVAHRTRVHTRTKTHRMRAGQGAGDLKAATNAEAKTVRVGAWVDARPGWRGGWASESCGRQVGGGVPAHARAGEWAMG